MKLKSVEAAINGAGQIVPIQEIRMKQPVPFNGPSSLTLLDKQGELNYYPELGVVTAQQRGKDKVLIIPLAAIAYMVEVPEPEVKPEPAPAPAAEPAPAPAAEPAPVPEAGNDTSVFVRDEKTGAIREMAKKVAQAKAVNEDAEK